MVTKDPRCLSHMFAAEIFMHRFLLSSAVRTLNPKEADWFYTPVYTTCDLTNAGLPLPFKSPRVMRSAIQYISNKWPFWNRTDGADHFFVVPHDFAACFHYQVSTHVHHAFHCVQSLPLMLSLPFHSEVVWLTIVLTFPGRKGDRAWNSSIAATCYIGPNIWTGESCLSEGGFHHYSTLCSSAENASSLDFP